MRNNPDRKLNYYITYCAVILVLWGCVLVWWLTVGK
jgi:hypothetical protein